MWWSKKEPEHPSSFDTVVLDKEMDSIRDSRKKRLPPHPDLTNDKLKRDLIGLSFSGGGIRSATFNLGVIQAFAKDHLLRRVDYLSTVSGGGYIGSWLSSWAYHRSRSNTPGENHIGQVEAKLNREPKNVMAKPDPEQVHFLRQYSNYLTPRLGMLSGDTLAFVGTYIRNLLLNQLILFAFVFALLGIPWTSGLLLQLGLESKCALKATSEHKTEPERFVGRNRIAEYAQFLGFSPAHDVLQPHDREARE